jgi:hypothetical protein
VSETPLVPGPIYGLRTWEVVQTEDGERLAAPQRGTPWPPAGAWLTATCRRSDGHAAPAPECACGIHAWHPTRASAQRVLSVRRDLPGVVEAEGAVELHDEGFRAERGRPYAIVLLPGRNARLAARVADAYGAPVVEVAGADELLAWCRERGLGLQEGVVADLLGAEHVERRRRERADARRRTLLRLAAWAVAVVALLVVALLVFGDAASDGPVCGRFCAR